MEYDNYRFYQCLDLPFRSIECKKIEYNNYTILSYSTLHFVRKNIPEFIDPLILKYKTMKKTNLNK